MKAATLRVLLVAVAAADLLRGAGLAADEVAGYLGGLAEAFGHHGAHQLAHRCRRSRLHDPHALRRRVVGIVREQGRVPHRSRRRRPPTSAVTTCSGDDRDAVAEADRHRRERLPVLRPTAYSDVVASGSSIGTPRRACPCFSHPRALPLRPHRVGHVRGADVRGIRDDLRDVEEAVLALEIVDREAADMDRRRRVEPVPDVHHAVIERHRRVLQLEGAARLVDVAAPRG